MKYVNYGNTGRKASSVIMGCMRIADMEIDSVNELVHAALESGINTFDHADIYGGGESERKFGELFHRGLVSREDVILQSKCGIRRGFYDFSKEHITHSVDEILERLQTEYLDLLILHRPDVLADPEEIAEAFDQLRASGKVKAFGVSNMNPGQIELLEKYTGMHMQVNQLQLSLAHTGMVDESLQVNMKSDSGNVPSDSIMEYCILHDIGIQSWSSLQYGMFEGTFIGSTKYPELNRKLNELAEIYSVTPGAIAIAWILKLPAVKQAVVGSTKAHRMREMAEAADIHLSREEWYSLYTSAGNILP